MKYVLLVCFIFLHSLSFACLNEEHVTKSGRITIDIFTLKGLTFYKSQNKAAIELALKRLLADNPVSEDEKRADKNDIAVNYIKLGKLDEAEKILLELIKKYPENYSVNANLGTLYELEGKNKEALQLIKKAIAIDPASHGESEWFHVKILEFKLRNIPEEKIAEQNILNLYAIHKTPGDIANELTYQLEERIPFTPAPNLLMAKVLQEFGDYLADSVSIKAAYLIYEMGMDYDKNDILKLAEKRDALLPYFKKYKQVVPVINNYYLDPLLSAIKEDPGQAVSTIVDTGLNYFNQEEKERQEKEQQRKIMIGSSVVIIVGASLFLYFRSRKKTV